MGTYRHSRLATLSLKRLTLHFVIAAVGAMGSPGCTGRSNDPPTSKDLSATKANLRGELESKFKEIHLDMSEREVDQILAGYPCQRRQLAEEEKEEPSNPYVFGWKLKRRGSFVKTYECKPGANEEDPYIQVYFDDNHAVVGRLLSPKDEFSRKYGRIQLDMTEEQVDQILAGYPLRERRDVYDIEKDQALWPGGKHKRKASFVKTYVCKPDANEGDFYIDVYFDDNYYVVGKVMGEYIS